MSLWAGVLAEVEAELLRLSQEIGWRQVLPSTIVVELPEAEVARFRPILAVATAELGVALAAWAARERHVWYRSAGPALSVEAAAVGRTQVRCEFPPGPPASLGGSPDPERQ